MQEQPSQTPLNPTFDFRIASAFTLDVAAWYLTTLVVQGCRFICGRVATADGLRVDGANVQQLAMMLQASVDNIPRAIAIDLHGLFQTRPADVDETG